MKDVSFCATVFFLGGIQLHTEKVEKMNCKTAMWNYLVGAFNPAEKYGNLPQNRGEHKKKYLKHVETTTKNS